LREIAIPVSSTTAPTGWFQCTVSLNTTAPRTVENTGTRYVTVAAVVAPAARRIA
jgi:hypothetical protein